MEQVTDIIVGKRREPVIELRAGACAIAEQRAQHARGARVEAVQQVRGLAHLAKKPVSAVQERR